MNGAKEEDRRTTARLLGENEELRRRLEEAEQTLEAIRSGDVDALVVAGAQGEQVFTLTGAEHVYRVIVETMNEAALTVDPDGTILFSNQRFCDLLKTPMHEVVGRKVTTFAARPQQPSLGELIMEAQTAPAQRHITLQASDGAAVPVQMSASLLTTNGSTCICLVASDLTELEASARSIRVLREHQQALEESESRFRTIFEASRDAIVITDDEGTYVQVNPAVQAIFGLPPEQLIGHHLSEFAGDHIDVPVVWKDFQAAGSFHGEMPLTGADGQVRYVDAYAVANVLPGRHLCVIRDVTERKRAHEALENANEQLQAQAEELQVQAEELRATNDELRKNEQALQEAEEHLHLAMEAGRVGVWEWEVGTERVEWSQGIYRLLGCKPGEVTLSHEGFRQRIHPQDRQRQAQALRESMERCEDYSCEFRVVWMDGSVHWVEDRGQYVYLDDGNGTILRLRGVLSDIDARKQSEEALRSVALFPEENPAPTLRVARDGTLLFANGASASLLRWWDCRAGQAALEQIRQYVVQALDSQEIVEADVVCGPITYSFSIAPIASEGYANLYARDITERKRAEEALRESEQRYRRLVENLKGSHFIYAHDTKGVFTHLSESVTDVLGYALDEFMAHYGTYLTDHPVNQDVHRHTEGSLQGIRQPPYKVNIRHKDGSTRWLEVQEVPVFDAEGKVIAVEGVAQDITERQWAEEALRESEERHRFLVESVYDWIWEVDRNGVYTYVSPQCREMLGYEPQEIVGKTPYDLMPPEEARRVREVFGAAAGQAKPIRRLENVNRRKDGRLVVLETNGAPVLDAHGKLAGYRGIDRDITERKRAEEALRESRERLERAQEIAHLGSWELDLVNNRLTWSDEVYRIFGLVPQEFGATYEAFLDRVHAEDRAAVNAAYTGSLRENRDTYEIEHRVVRQDTGEIRFVHEKCEHFRDDTGRIVRSVGMVHDITERKQAEEALRRSEERYHRLFEDDLTGNFISTPEGRILLCNPAFARMFGFAHAREAVGTSLLDLYVDPKERESRLERLKRQGKIERLETWRKRRDGAPIYTVENFVGHFNERGELYEIKGYVFDDTERKHAEEARRERMKELACLHAVRRDIQEDLSIDELCRRAVEHLVPALQFPEITAAVVELNGKRFTSKNYTEGLSHGLHAEITVEGDVLGHLRVYYTQERPFLIPEQQNLVNGVAEALSTWLGRKRAEEALRESEQRYHRLFEDDLTGNFICTPEGQILLCNPSFARTFGFGRPQEAVGTSILDLYLDPQEREALLERLKQQGKIDRFEVWRKRRDGEPIYIVENLIGHFNEQGELYEIKGYVFDDTERKRVEEQLRDLTRTLESKVARRTAELEHRARQLQKLALELSEAEDRERKHLAEVLHDDLQQQLAAAKFHLQMLSNRLWYEPSQQAIAGRVDQMLKDAIEKSRNLSHELSPAVLYHGSLAETFSWLAGQVQAKHGLIVYVDALNEVAVQSDALKAFLYKAAQELLFNVVKHARVNEARIRLRRVGRCVCLSVSDHGRGFEPQELRETSGFGLFSIRERIELLGGRMKIKSAKGQGSTFHIVVPDGQETQVRGLWTEDRAALRDSSSALRPPSSGPVLRVLLADDHKIVREGLASLLAEVPGIEVVGEAANGREAINQASRLRPDVVVMDVAMPLINGDEATRQIKLHLPGTRVVALSMYDEADLIEKMQQAGAEGYVLKTAPTEDLVAAIRGR